MRQNSGGEFGNSVAKLLGMDLSSMVWWEMRRWTWEWNGLTQQVEVRYQELPSTFGHWGKCWAIPVSYLSMVQIFAQFCYKQVQQRSFGDLN
jgi:hypothetical protein